ncbi:MAG: hypothetical protein KA313_08340 [Pseudarcicella sp.]|nr:hypothetical protein [Pseudarcicella sp.]MBP6411091.1 hypothetical protein [Pseudarcicella sp.]
MNTNSINPINNSTSLQSWSKAWQNNQFRWKFIGTLILFSIIAFNAPTYLGYIQTRKGVVLNDFILESLPALDVSNYIFVILYSLVVYFLSRTLCNAQLFLLFSMTFVIETYFRMLTIYLFPLEPPLGLIELSDPFAAIFIYGKKGAITHDLFFSGHTATMLIVCLFMKGKIQRFIAYLAALIVIVLLLIQHIHYTIDILGAFFFTFLAYFLAKRIYRI